MLANKALDAEKSLVRDALASNCHIKACLKKGREHLISLLKALKPCEKFKAFKFRKLAELGKGNNIEINENEADTKLLSYADFLISQQKINLAEKILNSIDITEITKQERVYYYTLFGDCRLRSGSVLEARVYNLPLSPENI